LNRKPSETKWRLRGYQFHPLTSPGLSVSFQAPPLLGKRGGLRDGGSEERAVDLVRVLHGIGAIGRLLRRRVREGVGVAGPRAAGHAIEHVPVEHLPGARQKESGNQVW